MRKKTDEDENLDYDLDHDEYKEHNNKQTKTNYIINRNKNRPSTNKTDKITTRIMERRRRII